MKTMQDSLFAFASTPLALPSPSRCTWSSTFPLTFLDCSSELLFFVCSVTAIHCRAAPLRCTVCTTQRFSTVSRLLRVFFRRRNWRRQQRLWLAHRKIAGILSSSIGQSAGSTGSRVHTHPLEVVVILCRSLRHCSQKYSSGLVASSVIPTQPPCCHTLQISHCINHPVVSSAKDAGSDSSLERVLAGSGSGNPGYSWFPQMHLVTSSSTSSSLSSSVSGGTPFLGSSWLLLVLRGSVLAGASGSSDDCDRAATELCRGEGSLFCGWTLRSARPEDIDEEEELVCCGADGVSCVARARDERRGDMTPALGLLENSKHGRSATRLRLY